ncbi:histidine kinase [Thalassotalea insulae]|uniref:Histidine kinase n=1 Tax=Thalassotalea insulae TaxID=2056778 RepID=A0ABQ6GVP3_9GAMM|nr:FecR family protein [Thalassotalea insulae]GLX79447.1 histidine kinase [Thalassotalea insulae]
MNIDNNVVSLHNGNTIDDEASLWLVRLDNGHLSEQSKKELKHWLAADKRHPAALKAMADIWDDMDEVLNSLDDKHSAPESVTLWPILKPIFTPFALAASISFFAIFIWLLTPGSVEKNSYATITGQQLDATFDDGSIIHLNTNSRIETEFSDEKRLIKLVKGEALFEVAHDPERPFIVYVGDRLVQAIGTKFVVHLHAKNVQVTVTDGKVKMSKVNVDSKLADIKAINTADIQKDDIYLAKGDNVFVANEQAPIITQFKPENIERELSWLDGKLIFDNEELFDVIEEVNRYFNIKIVLKDPSLHHIRISGRFDLDDSDALIEALELSFNIQSQRLDANKILLTKKA